MGSGRKRGAQARDPCRNRCRNRGVWHHASPWRWSPAQSGTNGQRAAFGEGGYRPMGLGCPGARAAARRSEKVSGWLSPATSLTSMTLQGCSLIITWPPFFTSPARMGNTVEAPESAMFRSKEALAVWARPCRRRHCWQNLVALCRQLRPPESPRRLCGPAANRFGKPGATTQRGAGHALPGAHSASSSASRPVSS